MAHEITLIESVLKYTYILKSHVLKHVHFNLWYMAYPSGSVHLQKNDEVEQLASCHL